MADLMRSTLTLPVVGLLTDTHRLLVTASTANSSTGLCTQQQQAQAHTGWRPLWLAGAMAGTIIAVAAADAGTAPQPNQYPKGAWLGGSRSSSQNGTFQQLLWRWQAAHAEQGVSGPAAGPAAQAAIGACLAGPLLFVLQGERLPLAALEESAAALAAQVQQLRPWELATALWGYARMGACPREQHMQPLVDAAVSTLAQQPLYDAIATAWALYTLDLVPEGLWGRLVARIAAERKDSSRTLDEAGVLYLLHAAMQQAALDVAAGQGGASSSSTPPRATKEEVAALLRGVPKGVRARVLEAYQVCCGARPGPPWAAGCRVAAADGAPAMRPRPSCKSHAHIPCTPCRITCRSTQQQRAPT